MLHCIVHVLSVVDIDVSATPLPDGTGCPGPSFAHQRVGWLGRGLLAITLLLLMANCTSVAELTPVTLQTTNPAQFPDFNFIASAPDTVKAGQVVPVELYIRQKVATPVTSVRYRLGYTVSGGANGGELVLKNDTLRTGDIGSLLYSDLSTYRYVASFRPGRTTQQQTIQFSCSDNDTRVRQGSISFVVK